MQIFLLYFQKQVVEFSQKDLRYLCFDLKYDLWSLYECFHSSLGNNCMWGFSFVFLETISCSKLVNFFCSCKHVRVKEKLSWGLTMKIAYWSYLGCYFLATLSYHNSCRLSHLYLWLWIGFMSINSIINAIIQYRWFNMDRIIVRCIFLKLYVFQNL